VPDIASLAGLRRLSLRFAAFLFAPLLLRLLLGRWVQKLGIGWFTEGMADQSVSMPPLIRGLLNMPGGRQMIYGAAGYAWNRHPGEWLKIPGERQFLYDISAYAWHEARGTLDPGGPPDLGGNLLTAWTGPGLGFLHIEKCGGIAAMQFLSRQFHPLQINPDDHRDLPPHLCFRTPAFAGFDPARYPLVWGHYDAPSLRRFAPGHRLFTLLRAPGARLLSLYHFWHSVDPSQLDPDLSFSVMLAHRLSLEEFLACDDPMLLDLTDNIYTRRLTGLYATGAAEDPLRADTHAAVAQATAALDGLDYVGITERMDESMARLAAMLGMPPPEAAVRANVTAENHENPGGWFRQTARPALSAAAALALDRRTELDRQLYEKALAAFIT
jgi:hypothetical protein